MRAALLLVDSLPNKPLRVLDAGAGAGFLSLELIGLLAKTRPGSEVILSDISETALELANKRIEKALGLNSKSNGGLAEKKVKVSSRAFDLLAENEVKVNSRAFDLLAENKVKVSSQAFDLREISQAYCPWADGTFDLIFLAQTLWGLIENLEGLFPGLRLKLKSPGYLIMSQHFPGPKGQNYASFVDPSLVSKLAQEAGFKLLHTLETDRMENHHWAASWTCD
jgi:SAM-dependent methyltransferase